MCTLMTNREYKERYLQDVNEHKDAEQITLQVLNNLNNGYIYEDVTKDESCYSKGDIKMIKDDTIKYIDVKDDARINETNNIFVEAGGWSKIYNCHKKGWIDSKYDYVAIVDQQSAMIWIIDFKQLQKVYSDTDLTHGQKIKCGEFWDNIKWGYIVPLASAIRLNCVCAQIIYDFDDVWKEYTSVNYRNKSWLKECLATKGLKGVLTKAS